jgi:hypothetical protein
MGTYAAELYMPGVTPEQLLDTARRAKAASADMTAEGTRLTYLSAILMSPQMPTGTGSSPHPGKLP